MKDILVCIYVFYSTCSDEDVGFEEHVLLNHLLEGFPTRGRHIILYYHNVCPLKLLLHMHPQQVQCATSWRWWSQDCPRTLTTLPRRRESMWSGTETISVSSLMRSCRLFLAQPEKRHKNRIMYCLYYLSMYCGRIYYLMLTHCPPKNTTYKYYTTCKI